LLAEQEAAVRDDRHWIHQSHYRLFANEGADLHVMLPAGARLLFLTLDGAPVIPRQLTLGSFWLSLTGSRSQHVLRLRWHYPEGEKLAQPNVTAPELKGCERHSVLGTVLVPAGYSANSTPTTAVDVVICRARAYLLLAKALHARNAGAADQESEAARQQCLWQVRQAKYLAARSKSSAPAHAEIQKLLQEVRQALYASKSTSELNDDVARQGLPTDIFESRALFVLPDDGRAMYWDAEAGHAPHFVLTASADHGTQAAILHSQVLMLIVLFLGIVSLSMSALDWLGRLWPEQIILLGGIGWLWLGPSMFGALLILAGAVARLILIAHWLHRSRHKQVAAAAGSGSSPS
jgi:hypothetical protein